MFKYTKLALASAVLLAAAAPAAAQYGSSVPTNQSGQNQYDPSGNGGQYDARQSRHRHGNRMAMSQEQRLMWRMDMHQQLRSMSPDQRKAYLRQARSELMAMDTQAREQKLSDLQNRWNALPAQRQQRIMARINARRGQGNGYQGDDQQQNGGQYQRGPSQQGRYQDEQPSGDDTTDQQ